MSTTTQDALVAAAEAVTITAILEQFQVGGQEGWWLRPLIAFGATALLQKYDIQMLFTSPTVRSAPPITSAVAAAQPVNGRPAGYGEAREGSKLGRDLVGSPLGGRIDGSPL